jgi:predicted nucleic acid-binding protein
MRAFDTSSIVYAWDNYPIEQFPKLWEWLGQQCASGEIAMSVVALDEVVHVSPECCEWLTDAGVTKLPVTNAVVQMALELKASLGIENHYGIGVGENDLFIVATASTNSCSLVSNEATQQKLPLIKSKYKMPAVCAMSGVNVGCISFLDYLKNSSVVFG